MDYITISCCIYCIYIDCYTGIKSLLLSIRAYPFLVMDFTPCFLFLIISWPCSFPWLCCILHSWHCAMLLDIYVESCMPLYFLIRSFVQDSIQFSFFLFLLIFFFQVFLACLMVERRQLVGKGFLTSLLSVKMLLIIFGSLVSINDSLSLQWRTKFRKAMNKADNDASTRAIDSLINYEVS